MERVHKSMAIVLGSFRDAVRRVIFVHAIKNSSCNCFPFLHLTSRTFPRGRIWLHCVMVCQKPPVYSVYCTPQSTSHVFCNVMCAILYYTSGARRSVKKLLYTIFCTYHVPNNKISHCWVSNSFCFRTYLLRSVPRFLNSISPFQEVSLRICSQLSPFNRFTIYIFGFRGH